MRSSDSVRVYDEQNPVVVESGWPWLSRAGEAVHSVGIDGIIQAKALFGGENMSAATQSGAPLADGDTWLWNGTWTKLTPTGRHLDLERGQFNLGAGLHRLHGDPAAQHRRGDRLSPCRCRGPALRRVQRRWIPRGTVHHLDLDHQVGSWLAPPVKRR